MIELASNNSAGVLPYVYRLDNMNTGEFYIGFRESNTVLPENDIGIVYKTSSKFVKHRINEFTPSVLAVFYSAEDAYWFEQELIEHNFKVSGCLNKKFNRYNGNSVFCYSPNSNNADAREKISRKMTGRKQSFEHSEKNRLRQTGINKSEEHKKAMRVPKTITAKLLEAHSKIGKDILCNRKISCIFCHKQTSLNFFSRHLNCK